MKRCLFLGIFLLVFLAVSIPAQAQTISAEISGYARARGTNQPAPGTLVSLGSDAGEAIQQVTPEGNGRFVFTGLRRGIYYVTASAPGYHEAVQRADLHTTPRASVFLNLIPDERRTPEPSTPPPGTVNQRELAVPENAQKEYDKGRKLLDDNEAEKSIPHFHKAIERYPSYVSAYFFLGVAKMNLRQWKGAEEALRRATELNDKLGPGFLALGTCLNSEGNFAAAEKPLLRGLELNPETADGHFELGRAYWALDRWQEAEPHARKAVDIRPDGAPAHLLLGNILLKKREAKLALGEFKEYLRLAPDGPFAAPTRDIVAQIELALGANGTPR